MNIILLRVKILPTYDRLIQLGRTGEEIRHYLLNTSINTYII